MSDQQKPNDFETKYVEKKCWDIPDPLVPGSGIQVVIYFWDDPEEKIPRLSIRGYYSDKKTGEVRREKGTKIRYRQIQNLMNILGGVSSTIEKNYPNSIK